MIVGKTVCFPKLSYWYHWKADVKLDHLEKGKLPILILIPFLGWQPYVCQRHFQYKEGCYSFWAPLRSKVRTVFPAII